MDVVAGCQAFVGVSEHGSFTLAASALRVPQSVISRRVAALEKHLGDALFERSSRWVVLTPFGTDLLPSAKHLLHLADTMRYDAELARRKPLRLAVPDACSVARLARLEAQARHEGVHLDLVPAGPAQRAELARTLGARAALIAVPADQGTWAVPLGLAGVNEPPTEVIHLESLRPARARSRGRAPVVRIQPEDDVPHVRDPLTRLRDALALKPSQVAVAASLTTAVAEVLDSADLLLCPQVQAVELGLSWRPVGEIRLTRGYAVAAAATSDAERLRTRLWPLIARCLGAREER